jgi:hypothetical protein
VSIVPLRIMRIMRIMRIVHCPACRQNREPWNGTGWQAAGISRQQINAGKRQLRPACSSITRCS